MASLSKRPSNLSHSNVANNLMEHMSNPFLSLQKEVDRAINGFYDLFEPKLHSHKDFENMNLLPSMDLVEDANCYKLEVEMPGMDEKDIKVSLDNNVLTIHGEKSVSKKDERKNYIAREINYGCYERSISLPQFADCDKATASFKKGMLWVTIPKKAGSRQHSHEIKINKV